MSEPQLLLTFDVHPVGPRPDLATGPVYLALKLASCFDSHPDDPTDAQLNALMPWSLLPDDKTKFHLMELDATGSANVFASVTAHAPVRPSGSDAFFEALRTEFRGRIEKLADHIEFGWGRKNDPTPPGIHVEQGDEEVDDTGTDVEKWPWLGISSSLAALQASLSRDMRARWLLAVDDGAFDQLWERIGGDRDPLILVIPASVQDSRDAAVYSYRSTTRSIDPEGNITAEIHYLVAGDDEKQLIGYMRPLPGHYLRKDIVGTKYTDFKDYWLTVEDSRTHSLADVDQTISSNAAPLTLAALLPESERAELIEMATVPPSVPTKAELDAFNAGVSLQVEGMTTDIDKHLRGFVLATLSIKTEADNQKVADAMAVQALAWWVRVVVAVNNGLPATATTFQLNETATKATIAKRIDPLFRVDAVPGPVLPGEGIDFLVGDPKSRLVGEASVSASERNYKNELAEYGVLVRRSSDPLSPPSDGWRLVTGGIAVIDPERALVDHPWSAELGAVLTYLPSLLPRGIALAFKDGVLRNDDCYKGQLLVGPNAMARLNEGKADEPDEPGLVNEGIVEFVSPGPVRTDVAHAMFGLAPPLRYRDRYDLAVFLIDRAGGMPREISFVDDPTTLDLAKFAMLDPPQAKTVQFLRRVPVGDLNVRPIAPDAGVDPDGKLPDGKRPRWPTVPKGVKLRASEWLDGVGNTQRPDNAIASQDTPVILLNTLPNANYKRDAFSFSVEPPQIDEFTLQRWALPSMDTPAAQATKEIVALKTELERIASLRGLPEDPAHPVNRLPHDPCVFGIAYQLVAFDAEGNAVAALGTFGTRSFSKIPDTFQKKPIEIVCAMVPSAPGSDRIVLPLLPEGHFAVLRLELLVSDADHQRFDDAALKYDLLNVIDCEGVACRAHPSATIAIETATAAMPLATALYEGFSVGVDAAANVVARFDAPRIAGLQFVDRFEMERQRWVWRNLPNIVETPATGDSDERRLSSGLPLELTDAMQTARDNSLSVLEFDAKAIVDRGFVMRPLAEGHWPRTPDGAVANKADLFVDTRDTQNAADYLRYSFTAISRYDGLWDRGLQVMAQPTVATLPDPDFEWIRGAWRRVAAPYRGASALRPLNVLALLPLTAQPKRDPSGVLSKPDLEASTPFLILFDEIWFREYGPGEVLRAELALEDREIGETDADKRPARLGPLPTKHVVARWDAKHPKVWTDEDAEQEPALRLQCYGPFGYSLDRTGNEALANATAFVVYVPDKLWKIGPQWSAFVRFRRVLHSLSSNGARAALPAEIVGGLSGVYPLYTLADSAQLAMPTAIAEPGLHTARLETQAGKTVLTSDELLFNLSPYHRDGAPAPTEVQNQFRYLLLMGRGGIDGGRGVEVFLPEHAYWVRQDLTITAMGPGTDTINPDARWTRGQILEIELDTITPPDQKAGGAVDMAGDLRDVFRAMLPEPDKSTKVHESDSPGRISRVSAIFAWNSVV